MSQLIEPLNGRFFRIVFAQYEAEVLNGVRSPEGRFHHAGQRAFYASPRADWAGIAVDGFRKPDDAPRITIALDIRDARVIDFRKRQSCTSLGLPFECSRIPWQPQRALGQRATSWIASDASRESGADGMIYPARSDTERWHLLLFRWNELGGPQVRVEGQN